MKTISEAPSYSVSEDGQIHSSLTGKVLKPRWAGKYRYPAVSLRVNGKTLQRLVHRLVAEAYLEVPDELKGRAVDVNHIDGNKENSRLENLEWVTHQENCQKAGLNGQHPRGELRVGSKLTAEKVFEIRTLLEAGVPQSQIASEYGIAQATVSAIKLGKKWKYT